MGKLPSTVHWPKLHSTRLSVKGSHKEDTDSGPKTGLYGTPDSDVTALDMCIICLCLCLFYIAGTAVDLLAISSL